MTAYGGTTLGLLGNTHSVAFGRLRCFFACIGKARGDGGDLLHLAVGGIVVSALLASKVYEWSGHIFGGVVVVSLEGIWSVYVYV